MKLSIVTLGLVTACAVGCASRPVPAARVGSAEAAVRAAREVGAERIPDANLHLTMAEDQLGKARRLIQRGDTEDAEWLLVRAESDGDLAVALAREAQQKAITDQTTQRIRQMSTMPSMSPAPAPMPATPAPLPKP